MFDEIWLNFGMRSGAKVRKSCRSCQELSNEYLLAKVGVDTAEDGPLKVCQEKFFRLSETWKKTFLKR